MVVPRLRVSGHYAGAASRAAAAVLDIGIVLGSFTVGLAGVDLLTRVVFGVELTGDRAGPISVAALAGWAFTYVYASLAVAGRTIGKGIVGLRVVTADGSTLPARRALVRTISFPLSALPLGLGFAGIVVHGEHRALHDLIAGTAVVYDWGGRAAELPAPLSAFLARKTGADYSSRPPIAGGE